MSEYHYQKDVSGFYVLYDNEGQPINQCTEVFVMLELDPNNVCHSILHKHGSEDSVLAHKAKWEARGALKLIEEFGNKLVIFSTKDGLTLDDLNRSLSTTGYVGKAYQNTLLTLEGDCLEVDPNQE